MPSLSTLIDDVHDLAEGKREAVSSTEVKVDFDKWHEVRGPRKPKTIYFSELGKPCLRQLWYNHYDPLDDITGKQKLKFFYGDMLEELVLRTAQAAGHEVSAEQLRVEHEIGNGWKVTGRIDAIIDGVVVDVKSTTKYGEEKFKNGLKDDPFGYYHQLNGYAVALGYSNASFVSIQKELGSLGVWPIKVDVEEFVKRAALVSAALEAPHAEVLGSMPTVPQSTSSKNMKLGTTCSYCPYKNRCFPNLRTFLYSNGPVFLTEVVDVPRVLETTP